MSGVNLKGAPAAVCGLDWGPPFYRHACMSIAVWEIGDEGGIIKVFVFLLIPR